MRDPSSAATEAPWPTEGSAMSAWRAAGLLPVFIVSACGVGANVSTTDVSARGAVLSADVRAVVARDGLGLDGIHRRLVCAEPQPDAIRAVAQEFSAALATSSPLADAAGSSAAMVNASIAASGRSAIASIAQRTPTVQLMRDMLYRACEALMNGAMTPGLARDIVLQIDNMVIAMHAIDGLTGMVAAGQPGISASGGGAVTATTQGGAQPGASVPVTTLSVQPGTATQPRTIDAAAMQHVANAVVQIVAMSLNGLREGDVAAINGRPRR